MAPPLEFVVAQPPAGTGGKKAFRRSAEDLIPVLFPYVALAVMAGSLAFLQPATFRVAYVQNIVGLSTVLLLIAFGQGLVTMTGGIDLSVPGVLSVVNCIAATQMTTPERTWSLSAAILALGWIPGMLNGLVIIHGRMQPFIVTLAMWFIWGGVAFLILPGPGGVIDPLLNGLLSGRLAGLAGTTWLLVALLAFGLWLTRTRLGISIRAIGSDRQSARASGIAVDRTEIIAYALSGWFAVLAGLVLSAQSLSGEPTSGNTYVLPMITAVVVGGVSLAGGKGSLLGPIVGGLVLAYLTGVTFAFRLQPQWNQILQGVLLVLSIAATHILQRLVRGLEERRAR